MGAAVRQSLVDLVDEGMATARTHLGHDSLERRAWHDRPGGVGGRGEHHAACAVAPVARDIISIELVMTLGSRRNRFRGALEHPDEVPVARVTRVRHEPLVAGLDERPHCDQKRAGSPRRNHNPFGRDVDPVAVSVEARDCLSERWRAERGRVTESLGPERRHCRLDHLGRSGEIGLSDLHVHDVPSGALERLGAPPDLHHVERLDLAHASGKAQVFVSTQTGCRNHEKYSANSCHDAMWPILARACVRNA